MTTAQDTEPRYSVFELGDRYRVWDALDNRFVPNPMNDSGTADFDHRASAAQVRDELNAAAQTVRIKVDKGTLYSDLTRRTTTYYACTGPDGTQFDNTNLKTLRDVLRRRYGRVELEVS